MEIVPSKSVCDQMGPAGGSVLSGSEIKANNSVITMYYLLIPFLIIVALWLIDRAWQVFPNERRSMQQQTRPA